MKLPLALILIVPSLFIAAACAEDDGEPADGPTATLEATATDEEMPTDIVEATDTPEPTVTAQPPESTATAQPTEPPAQSCHPSYAGPGVCLDPNASDYDCAGGSGNGPLYTGRVEVVGPDVYDLDRDGDTVGCE